MLFQLSLQRLYKCLMMIERCIRLSQRAWKLFKSSLKLLRVSRYEVITQRVITDRKTEDLQPSCYTTCTIDHLLSLSVTLIKMNIFVAPLALHEMDLVLFYDKNDCGNGASAVLQ